MHAHEMRAYEMRARKRGSRERHAYETSCFVKLKGIIAIFDRAFQTTICNAALIWMDQGHSAKKEGGHLKFRTKLTSQLMAHSFSFKYTSPIDGFGVRTNLTNHIITAYRL